jgi:hypothetical protein
MAAHKAFRGINCRFSVGNNRKGEILVIRAIRNEALR